MESCLDLIACIADEEQAGRLEVKPVPRRVCDGRVDFDRVGHDAFRFEIPGDVPAAQTDEQGLAWPQDERQAGGPGPPGSRVDSGSVLRSTALMTEASESIRR